MKLIETMAKNQVILSNGEYRLFQSYSSRIAKIDSDNKVSLSPHYDYSRTTMKYLKQFLGHGIDETRKRLKSGEYSLDLEI